jgi:hypothetical protein
MGSMERTPCPTSGFFAMIVNVLSGCTVMKSAGFSGAASRPVRLVHRPVQVLRLWVRPAAGRLL